MMVYVTTRRKPREKKTSWLDIINDEETVNELITDGAAATVTRCYEETPQVLLDKINVSAMIQRLEKYNKSHQNLFAANREDLYTHFKIPKRTGGLREIDAPCEELQDALKELKDVLQDRFGVLYHTSAYAYINKRNTYSCVKKHKDNESNWFYKTDISGFFPNTTLEFAMKMCSMIFPLSEICKDENGRKELEKALSLGFLNNKLPQGTKLSPYLSNLVTVPIDFKIFNDLSKRRFVYNRYADDIHISCKQTFSKDKMSKYIQSVFAEFESPWILKPEKTHYGSRKGRNELLGLHLNADNDITVGWRNKAAFKGWTNNLIMDYLHGKLWTREKLDKYAGIIGYYKYMEKEYFEKICDHFTNKYGIHPMTVVQRSLRSFK